MSLKVPTRKKSRSNYGNESFPKKELTKWLKVHKTWDHDDWLKLLDDLKAKGFGNLVSDQVGQDSVGLYLETNRDK
jgi:hypothetical protein